MRLLGIILLIIVPLAVQGQHEYYFLAESEKNKEQKQCYYIGEFPFTKGAYYYQRQQGATFEIKDNNISLDSYIGLSNKDFKRCMDNKKFWDFRESYNRPDTILFENTFSKDTGYLGGQSQFLLFLCLPLEEDSFDIEEVETLQIKRYPLNDLSDSTTILSTEGFKQLYKYYPKGVYVFPGGNYNKFLKEKENIGFCLIYQLKGREEKQHAFVYLHSKNDMLPDYPYPME